MIWNHGMIPFQVFFLIVGIFIFSLKVWQLGGVFNTVCIDTINYQMYSHTFDWLGFISAVFWWSVSITLIQYTLWVKNCNLVSWTRHFLSPLHSSTAKTGLWYLFKCVLVCDNIIQWSIAMAEELHKDSAEAKDQSWILLQFWRHCNWSIFYQNNVILAK